jgi:hypothetical protein
VLGLWGADGAKGDHSNYTFENLWLDNWYSLVQIEHEEPSVHGVTFKNIWALGQPPLAISTIVGDVTDVTFNNVKFGQSRATNDAELQLVTSGGAAEPKFPAPAGPVARFTVNPTVFGPRDDVTFTAALSPHTSYTWLFGDGTEAHGRSAHHRFADADGTELDGMHGAGRFRVLLKVEDNEDREDWAEQGLVAVAHWYDAAQYAGPTISGLQWHIYPGTWTELPDLSAQKPMFSGESSSFYADSHGFTRYATVWEGFIDIPADGGYTFHVMARDGVRLLIDGVEIAKTGPPFAQVCGSPGNAMRYELGSMGLRAGRHAFRLEGLHSVSQGTPRVLWEGPSLPLNDVPPEAFSHARVDTISGTE